MASFWGTLRSCCWALMVTIVPFWHEATIVDESPDQLHE